MSKHRHAGTYVYEGRRSDSGQTFVKANGVNLSLHLHIANHSPTGFEWGYGGSGPAQLALAILANHFGPGGRDRALSLHQDFKFLVTARLSHKHWVLTSEDVARAVAEIEAKRAEVQA